ncbi:Hypothetical_protein [Hexamita inflata]|uniref:Hypothetical_protein n=1 Tax=Hexamita inflata TaxID=28002 RepID=A0AA86PRV5_9EUKA|nr:Hypothetical protein HINF_LOCUS30717 [Hexamita inflata]
MSDLLLKKTLSQFQRCVFTTDNILEQKFITGKINQFNSFILNLSQNEEQTRALVHLQYLSQETEPHQIIYKCLDLFNEFGDYILQVLLEYFGDAKIFTDIISKLTESWPKKQENIVVIEEESINGNQNYNFQNQVDKKQTTTDIQPDLLLEIIQTREQTEQIHQNQGYQTEEKIINEQENQQSTKLEVLQVNQLDSDNIKCQNDNQIEESLKLNNSKRSSQYDNQLTMINSTEDIKLIESFNDRTINVETAKNQDSNTIKIDFSQEIQRLNQIISDQQNQIQTIKMEAEADIIYQQCIIEELKQSVDSEKKKRFILINQQLFNSFLTQQQNTQQALLENQSVSKIVSKMFIEKYQDNFNIFCVNDLQ